MKTSSALLWFCLACLIFSVLGESLTKTNSSEVLLRSKRYTISAYRPPLIPEYQRNFYVPDVNQKPSSPTQEVPSGYHQFEPDKNSDSTKKAASSQKPAPVERIEEPKIISKAPEKEIKIVKTTGTQAVAETSMKPNILSVFGNVFRDPVTIVAAASIPLFFLGTLIVPYLTQMLFGLMGLPDMTTSFARGFARSLDGKNDTITMDRILDILNEYGARTMDDPRCIQRILCQAADSGIKSRRGDSWATSDVVQTLSKYIDDSVLETVGLKNISVAVKKSDCDMLECSGTTAYVTEELPLMEKLVLLTAKFYYSYENHKSRLHGAKISNEIS